MDNVPLTNKTRSIGKPKDWVEELDGPCVTIDVYDYMDEHLGIPFMRTAWRPTEAELEALKTEGVVWLDISGHTHPVIRIFIEGKQS